MNELRVPAIPESTNVAELRSFLGFCNFYRTCCSRTIHRTNVACMAAKYDAQAAFERIKERFRSAGVPTCFWRGLPVVLEAGALAFALGAALSRMNFNVQSIDFLLRSNSCRI